MVEKFRVTVKEKMLIHLLGLRKSKDEFEVPPEATQGGMADVIGVRRSHIASTLKNLKEESLVEERKTRVSGQERRKNAYFLSHEGEGEALRLKEHLLHKTVVFPQEDGTQKEMEIIGINKLLPEKLPLVEILKCISEDGIYREAGVEEEEVPGLAVQSSVLCPFCGQDNINPGLTEIRMSDGFIALSAVCSFCGNGFMAQDVTPPDVREKRIYRALYIPPEARQQAPPGQQPGGDALLVSFGLFFMLASFALLLLAAFGYIAEELCLLSPMGILISLIMLYLGLRHVRQLNDMSRRVLIVTGAVFVGFIAFLAGAAMDAEYDSEEMGTMAFIVFPAFALFIFGKPLAGELRSELSLSLGVFLVLFGTFLTAFHGLFSWNPSTSPFWVISGAVMVFLSYEIHRIEKVLVTRALCSGAGAFCAVFCAVLLIAGYTDMSPFRVAGIIMWLLVGILLFSTRFAEPENAQRIFAALRSALIAGLGLVFALAGVVLALNGRLMVSVVEFFIGLPIIWFGLQNVREYGNKQIVIIAFILLSETVAALSFILA